LKIVGTAAVVKNSSMATSGPAELSARLPPLDTVISQTVEQVELDNELHEIADERWKGILASGKTLAWEDAKAYLVAKSPGESPHKPLARSSKH
jgi:hypothetical protein